MNSVYLLDRRAPFETFIAREVAALGRRGRPVDVVVFADLAGRSVSGLAADRAARNLLRRAGSECAANPLLALRLLRHLPHARGLAARLASAGARHLHAHFAWLPADVAAAAAAACGIPWTCSAHAWDVFARPPAETRRRLRGAAAVVGCTRAACEALIRAGLRPERVHLVRHGLPVHDSPPPPAGRDAAGLLAAGRLVRKKGFDTLVGACALLRARGVDCACRIIGDGPERAALARAIRRAGLDARVVLEPALPPERMLAAIGAATLLVLPSRRLPDGDRDGLANVVAEAMAAGTPVVTTPAGAAGELIADGRNGRLVPPEDAAALADALASLLADAPLRARLAAAARRTAAEYLDEKTEINKLIAVFDAARIMVPSSVS